MRATRRAGAAFGLVTVLVSGIDVVGGTAPAGAAASGDSSARALRTAAAEAGGPAAGTRDAGPIGIQGTCYASGCTGVEPNGTTCAADAINARVTTGGGRTVILRYSPSCRAAWGKITSARIGDYITVMNDTGDYYERRVTSGSDQHTVMVNDAGITSWACGFQGTTLLACTGSY